MEIKKYSKSDAEKLFDMMREEGPDWECYFGDGTAERYRLALDHCVTIFGA